MSSPFLRDKDLKHTELSSACKYGIVTSLTIKFQELAIEIEHLEGFVSDRTYQSRKV